MGGEGASCSLHPARLLPGDQRRLANPAKAPRVGLVLPLHRRGGMVSRRIAMRIGVIQSGRLVEERVLTQPSVSLGRTASSSVIVPSDRLPRPWRLFERRGGRYRMRLGPAMEGRIASGGEVATVAAEREVLLPERARGRVALGDLVILFQIVSLP